MLRHIAKVSLSTGRVALRHYANPAAHSSTTPSLRRLAPLSVAALTPRRWCSSKVDLPSAAAAAAAAGGAPLAPANVPEDDSTTSTPSLAAQLSGLSSEDQQRIIAALQQPEKEKSSVMGGAGIGPADGEMVAAFTCGPCDYRMVKRFSKHAYTKGIVIVECPNCRAKHLLADNLGWLEDEAKNIEEILREKGESFTRIGGTAGDFQVVHGETADKAAPSPSPAQG